MLQGALTYRNRDRLCTIPLPYGSKRPAILWKHLNNWQRPQTVRHLEALFNGGQQNIAAILGHPSCGAFALDCDTPATFDDICRLLTGLGISTRVIRRPPNGSEHDGGGTYLLRAPEAVKSKKHGDLDILGQGRYTLLPLSTHPQGGVYFDNDLPIFQLPSLAAIPTITLERADKVSRIPTNAYQLLAGEQDALASYASRSEAEMSICCALALRGYTFARVLALFKALPGPGKFKEKLADDERAALAYLRMTWDNAGRWVKANPSEVVALAQELRSIALTRPWPGRSGSYDRAVYLAHLAIVERCAQQPHGASVRELAELAGTHWSTASKANHRLIDAGLLELAEPAKATYSAKYSLAGPKRNSQSHVGVDRLLPFGPAHDLFRWQGLNKSAQEVLTALSDRGALTVKELVALTGRGRRTINRKLKAMFAEGLVEPLGGGVWCMVAGFDPADLDDVAVRLGVAGIGERQRQRHAQERYGHQLELIRGQET